jgi:gamma-glutamylcyclotransferase (GGCT)/AIG2-like uncharacterized protein YtfP
MAACRTNRPALADTGPLDRLPAGRYPAPMPDAPTSRREPEPNLLFVYGTLRPSLAGGAGQLVASLVQAGAATMRGLLYDLGSYPGMVAGDGLVHGEVLRLSDPDQLAALDAYEECHGPNPLYRRELTIVRRENGEETVAWAYFYAGSVTEAKRIAGGDYLAHRRGG